MPPDTPQRRSLQAGKAQGEAYKLADSGGLYLEVAPSGGKWWRLKYRINGKDGKEKRISLGVYPEISLKDARDRRDDAKKQIAIGIDPSEHRKAHKATRQERAANSFEIVAREWFAKHSPNWVASHSSKILRRFEADVFSWIGGRQYVFPGARTNGRPMSENTVNATLRRLGYSSDEMTGHGFRSMASTLLNEQGWNRDAIERQLAHAERDNVRAAYNYAEHLPERKRMMQAWADYLDGLATGAPVIPIRGNAA